MRLPSQVVRSFSPSLCAKGLLALALLAPVHVFAAGSERDAAGVDGAGEYSDAGAVTLSVTLKEANGAPFHDPSSVTIRRLSPSDGSVLSEKAGDEVTFSVEPGEHRLQAVWHEVVLADTVVEVGTLEGDVSVELEALERVTVFILPVFQNGEPHRSALMRIRAPDGTDVTELFPGVQRSLWDTFLSDLVFGSDAEYASRFSIYPLDLSPNEFGNRKLYQVEVWGRIPPSDQEQLAQAAFRFTSQERLTEVSTFVGEDEVVSSSRGLVAEQVRTLMPQNVTESFVGSLPPDLEEEALRRLGSIFMQDQLNRYADVSDLSVGSSRTGTFDVRDRDGRLRTGELRTVEVTLSDGSTGRVPVFFEGDRAVADSLLQTRARLFGTLVDLRDNGQLSEKLSDAQGTLESLETVEDILDIAQTVAWIRDLSWILAIEYLKAHVAPQAAAAAPESYVQDAVSTAADGLARKMLDEAYDRSLQALQRDIASFEQVVNEAGSLSTFEQAYRAFLHLHFVPRSASEFATWTSDEWDPAGWDAFVESARDALVAEAENTVGSAAVPVGSHVEAPKLVKSIGDVALGGAQGATLGQQRLQSLSDRLNAEATSVIETGFVNSAKSGVESWAVARALEAGGTRPSPTLTSSASVIEAGQSFSLSWDPVDEASSYRLEWAHDPSFPSLAGERTLTTTSVSHTITTAGEVRYFRVKADNSSYSNTVDVSAVEPAGAGDLTVTPSTVDVTGLSGDPAQRVDLSVDVNGTSSFSWTAGKTVHDGDPGWLKFQSGTPTPTGTQDDPIQLRLIAENLGPGTYAATVDVRSDAADNTPVEVPVRFDVRAVSSGGVDLAVVAAGWTDGRSPTETNDPEIRWTTRNLGTNTASTSFNIRDRVYLSDRGDLTFQDLVDCCHGNDIVDEAFFSLGGGQTKSFAEEDRSLVPPGTGRWYYYIVTDAADIAGEPEGFVAEDVETTSPNTNNIYRMELFVPAPAKLTADPDSVQPSVPKGATRIDSIRVRNDGDEDLDWSASSGATWLSLGATGGTLAGRTQRTLELVLSSDDLALGSHRTTVSVTSNGGSAEVPVALEVFGRPTLDLSRTELSFSIPEGSTPPPRHLTIRNGGSDTLRWTGSSGADWLEPPEPRQGVLAPDSISREITVQPVPDSAGLEPGSYTTFLVFRDSAAGTADTADIRLEVTSGPTIGTSPDSLSFTAAAGTNPPDTAFVVENTGGGTLRWRVSSEASWLTTGSAGGDLIGGERSVPVPVAALPGDRGLEPGRYGSRVVVRDTVAGLADSIPVQLEVTERAAGEIIVGVGRDSTATVVPNDTVSLPIRVDLSGAGELDLASLEFRVNWDTARLTYLSASTGEYGTVTINESSTGNGQLYANVFGSEPASVSFDALSLRMRAGDQTGRTTVDVRVEVAGDASGVDILSTVHDRDLSLCVGSGGGRFGDVTADGDVNVVDAQQIARHSVGLAVSRPGRLDSHGDVTGDGAVNVIDAQQVARFSVGLPSQSRAGEQAPGGC